MTIRVGVDVLMFLIFLMTALLWLGSCFFNDWKSGVGSVCRVVSWLRLCSIRNNTNLIRILSMLLLITNVVHIVSMN